MLYLNSMINHSESMGKKWKKNCFECIKKKNARNRDTRIQISFKKKINLINYNIETTIFVEDHWQNYEELIKSNIVWKIKRQEELSHLMINPLKYMYI